MLNIINDTDQVILNSVESYLRNVGAPLPTNPQEKLYVMQSARDALYSDIVQRVPRVAAYIMQNNLEEDQIAKGLFTALCKHAIDPIFIQLLMQYLAQRNDEEENGVTGALLAKIMNKLLDDKKVTAKPVQTEKKSDKDKTTAVKAEEPTPNTDDIKHIYEAVQCLLGNLASIIATRCGNVTVPEATAIAACIVMNNNDTIKEIMASDLPVSAQIFDIVKDPSNIIKSALNLNKADYVKLTNNQSNFIETLKKWVYEKLNQIPTQTSYQFIVAAYGSLKPDVSMKLIQLKDCGTQYSNLLAVAKQIVNN